MINIEEDALQAPEADTGKLGDLSKMAKAATALELEIKGLEEFAANKKRELRRLVETELPERMAELQLASLKLDNGFTLEIVDVISASISEARRPAAHEWLRENGHGDVIKMAVAVNFPRGQEETARALYESLRGNNSGDVSMAENVHPQTLKKLVRELLEQGVDVPFDVLGVWTGKQAHITDAAKGRRR